MYNIFKYNLDDNKLQGIQMPEKAEILSVQMQNDQIVLWALVNPDNPSVTRSFKIYGTGWGINENESKQYIGTVQDGIYVWHIFEIL